MLKSSSKRRKRTQKYILLHFATFCYNALHSATFLYATCKQFKPQKIKVTQNTKNSTDIKNSPIAVLTHPKKQTKSITSKLKNCSKAIFISKKIGYWIVCALRMVVMKLLILSWELIMVSMVFSPFSVSL